VPFQIVRHDYADKTVELHFFRCTIESGQAMPLDSAEIRWVSPDELGTLTFPPADRPIIEALRQEAKEPCA
jgi:hypothetical protein